MTKKDNSYFSFIKIINDLEFLTHEIYIKRCYRNTLQASKLKKE